MEFSSSQPISDEAHMRLRAGISGVLDDNERSRSARGGPSTGILREDSSIAPPKRCQRQNRRHARRTPRSKTIPHPPRMCSDTLISRRLGGTHLFSRGAPEQSLPNKLERTRSKKPARVENKQDGNEDTRSYVCVIHFIPPSGLTREFSNRSLRSPRRFSEEVALFPRPRTQLVHSVLVEHREKSCGPIFSTGRKKPIRSHCLIG